MNDAIEAAINLAPGLATTGLLLWSMFYVLEEHGLGLFFAFLSIMFAYSFILFGGVVGACCNAFIDKYIEACMDRRGGEVELEHTVGDLCSAGDALYQVEEVIESGLRIRQLSSDKVERVYGREGRYDLPYNWKRLVPGREVAAAMDSLRANVESKDGIDTFDMAALGVNNDRGIKSSSTFRAWLCLLLQVFAPGLLLLQMVGTHDRLGHSLCPWDEGWDLWYT